MGRCIALMTRLLRGPATTDEMLRVAAEYDDPNESRSDDANTKRFEKDRDRLQNWFGCELSYDRRTATYTLARVNRPLFDLSDDALRGLAFLQSTFSDETVVMSQEVLALFSVLQRTLSEQRRHDLQKQRGLIEIDLSPRDSDPIDQSVIDTVRRAYTNHHELEFEYLSPSRIDGQKVIHRVEPYRYFFGSGHFLLEAFCLQTRSHIGTFSPNELWRYRIGRMSDAQVLPARFIPGRRSVPSDELVYELSPDIARLGVTEHFVNSVVERHEDGSATIKTVSRILFLDLRALLHYGSGCRVVGGERAVKEMKKMVAALYSTYQDAN